MSNKNSIKKTIAMALTLSAMSVPVFASPAELDGTTGSSTSVSSGTSMSVSDMSKYSIYKAPAMTVGENTDGNGVNITTFNSNAKTPMIDMTGKVSKNDSSASFKSLPRISLEARYFAPKLTAEAKTDSVKMFNNDGIIDFKNTLGLGNDSAPELRLTYNNLSIDYMHLHSGGDANLTLNPVIFNNKTFTVDVNTTINFDYLSFNVTNKLVHNDNVKVDWTYGLTRFRFDANVKNKIFNESKSITARRPVLGLSAVANLDNYEAFQVYAAISGLPAGGYGHFYDAEAGLKYNIQNNISVTAGYRIIDLKVTHDNDYLNYKLSGPFFGATYNF